MRRRSASMSEIAQRSYDTLAEMPRPDAVHHDARGQGMSRLYEPICERQSPPGLMCAWPRLSNFIWLESSDQDRGDTRLHERPKARRVATPQYVGWRRLAAVPQRLNLGIGNLFRLEQLLFALEFFLVLPVCGICGL